ncbi:glycosyltransferase [Pseudarthrobacter sp. R1]|uniref:glycosyltransferase n=1 Tax=Pseudarthrobacter sp. R1 TaxID=2944934 RepID=UPI0021098D10|nr:glycosyltransferase [Pseudarthrobacter sp. R1]MCQ6271132.1 glycosyltransferase [Pseudarthrobacter sp. R1]
MPNLKQKILILYPYAYEERDAVSAMVRELTAMLGERNSVDLLALKVDRKLRPRRKTLDQWIYLAKALGYSVARFRDIDAIIAIDVPTGVRLVGVLPRILSGNRIINVSWVLDMYSTQVSRLQAGLLPRNRVIEFWDNLGLRASSHVVVLGQCMAEAVKRISGQDAIVIPIWKEPSVTGENLRERFGLRNDQFVLIYAGTAGSNHPMAALIEAVGSVENDNAVLLIAGRGSEVRKAREAVKRAGFSNVQFVDLVEDYEVPALHATADLHVAILDERVTGTCVPSKAYSAMAAGRACLFLGSDKSQAALDIAAADAGTTVGTSDVRAIADELKTYISTPGLAARRGRNGAQFISEQRSLAVSTTRWEKALS